MARSWLRRVFVGGTLGVAMFLSSAVLAQAQTCTTTYNPLLRQAVTQCTPALPSLLLPTFKPFDYAQTMQQVEQIKAQQLQNEILRLQLQELKRQQALRHDGAQQDPSAQRLQAEINRLRVEAERRGQR